MFKLEQYSDLDLTENLRIMVTIRNKKILKKRKNIKWFRNLNCISSQCMTDY